MRLVAMMRYDTLREATSLHPKEAYMLRRMTAKNRTGLCASAACSSTGGLGILLYWQLFDRRICCYCFEYL